MKLPNVQHVTEGSTAKEDSQQIDADHPHCDVILERTLRSPYWGYQARVDR